MAIRGPAGTLVTGPRFPGPRPVATLYRHFQAHGSSLNSPVSDLSKNVTFKLLREFRSCDFLRENYRNYRHLTLEFENQVLLTRIRIMLESDWLEYKVINDHISYIDFLHKKCRFAPRYTVGVQFGNIAVEVASNRWRWHPTGGGGIQPVDATAVAYL